jgi:6-phosphogluconolactonase (cycloisomerase 2 family)
MVSGLAGGAQVVLRDNGGDSLTVTANGAFTFATPIASGSAYSVTVAAEPLGQTCAVAGGSAASVTAKVSTVAVTCVATPQYAYVWNEGSNTISQFTIGADGALAPDLLGLVQEQSTDNPWAVGIDPAGLNAYVLNSNSNTIVQYQIGPGGNLQTPVVFATGLNPWALAFTPDGKFAYVTNHKENTVSQYAIGTGGALSILSPAKVATGTSPTGVTVDPSGLYVYVANFDGNTISQFNRRWRCAPAHEYRHRPHRK